MLNKELRSLIISGVLGDGHIIHDSKYRRMSFNNVNLDYITYKRDLFKQHNYVSKVWTKRGSGYNASHISYEFATGSSLKLDTLLKRPRLELIKEMSIGALVLYYLDDGSFKSTKNQIHIYCSSFTDVEVGVLITRIYELFPQKKCTKRLDRKKDGRVYPYIYMPTIVVKEFLVKVEDFIKRNQIYSLSYKTHFSPPSTTIESYIHPKGVENKAEMHEASRVGKVRKIKRRRVPK